MYRIQAVCLGHQKKITVDYQSVDQLKSVIAAEFDKYLVKDKVKKIPVEFILTYKDEANGNEELLKDMNVIVSNKTSTIFPLSVKRIWDSCCVCLNPFGIISDSLPCECQEPDCGYQYCNGCVKSIMECNSRRNQPFYCMYCGHKYHEGPQINNLLIDLLWKQFYLKYGSDLLNSLHIMPGTLLNDISCRITHVQCLIKYIKKKKPDACSIPGKIKSSIECGVQLNNDLKEIQIIAKEIQTTDRTDDYLQICCDKYRRLLSGNDEAKTNCELFIEICETLLYHIEQPDFETYFPTLKRLMADWEYSLKAKESFEPKFIKIYKSFEEDLNAVELGNLACRVGFFGNISVGKSSLVNDVRKNGHTYSDVLDAEIAPHIEINSPVSVGKSTLCQLEFEHQYSDGKNVILVDIQGSTDYDSNLKSGNYFDELRKANCELYILVFQDRLTDIHKKWYDYIVNVLHRECWLVRNKVDDLFLRLFREDVGVEFNSCSEAKRNKFAANIIQRIREQVSYDSNGEKLSNLYLTFSSSEINDYNRKLSEMPYAKFDVETLTENIKNLPVDFRKIRLQTIAMNAVAKIINICFRRGYVVNVLKYKIAAGLAAIIPFGDLIPRYLGREDIRQAFGVNNRSRFMAWWTGEKEELKDYLKGFSIEIDPNSFKTSALKTAFELRSTSAAPNVNAGVSLIARPAASAGIAGVSLTDDVIRVVGVGGINAVRGVSIAFIVVGVGLTAALCAWSAVMNGKQMYNYLNRLCDDMILISAPIAMKIIENNEKLREQHSINTK
ncbi:unnamed protein product [Rotaria socialis]